MNLTSFLKQTDEITEQYLTKQLISFIHDMGRVLPEDYREDFLKRLKAAGGKQKKAPLKMREMSLSSIKCTSWSEII